jgi:hypothetical protein
MLNLVYLKINRIALIKDRGGGSDMAPRGGGRATQDMFELFAVMSDLIRGRPALTP